MTKLKIGISPGSNTRFSKKIVSSGPGVEINVIINWHKIKEDIMAEKVHCNFCGKELDVKDDRVISGEFYEDISEGFAEGRQDLPDITLCADCYESNIVSKTN